MIKQSYGPIPESIFRQAQQASFGVSEGLFEPFLKAHRRKPIMGNKVKFRKSASRKRGAVIITMKKKNDGCRGKQNSHGLRAARDEL
jgi:hypothetical protein